VPDALAWHHGSASLGRWHPESTRRIARNQVYLAARYGGSRWAVVVAQMLWGAVAARHGCGGAWLRGVLEGRRGARTKNSPGLLVHLRQAERDIYALQEASGFDLYWRLYFLFTGGGAK
jgi:hypothetical protein